MTRRRPPAGMGPGRPAGLPAVGAIYNGGGAFYVTETDDAWGTPALVPGTSAHFHLS